MKIHPGVFAIVFLLIVGGLFYIAAHSTGGTPKVHIEEIR